MEQQLGARGVLDRLIRAHMIEVCVGSTIYLTFNPLSLMTLRMSSIVAGIDNHGFDRSFIRKNETVHLQRSHDEPDQHHNLDCPLRC